METNFDCLPTLDLVEEADHLTRQRSLIRANKESLPIPAWGDRRVGSVPWGMG